MLRERLLVAQCTNTANTCQQFPNLRQKWAIYSVLAPDYMKLTNSKVEWEQITEQTNERWLFLNCFAAVDGKHVEIICPKHLGSKFYNYKGFYSIVLLAFIDYDYRFLIADVGCQGRISDGGV